MTRSHEIQQIMAIQRCWNRQQAYCGRQPFVDLGSFTGIDRKVIFKQFRITYYRKKTIQSTHLFLYIWMIPFVTSTNGLPEKNPLSSSWSGCVGSFNGVVSLEPDGSSPSVSVPAVLSTSLLRNDSILMVFAFRWPRCTLAVRFFFLAVNHSSVAPTAPAPSSIKQNIYND